MRLLFISFNTSPLSSPINGDTQRTRLLYEACAQIAEVDILTLAGWGNGEQLKGRWRKWVSILPFSSITSLFPVNAKWEALVDETVHNNHYDYIVCRYLYRAIPCGLWKYRDKLIVDFDDALPFLFLNQIGPSSAWTTRLRLNLAAKKASVISKHAVQELHTAFFAKQETALANKGTFLPNIPFYGESCQDADMNTGHPRIMFVGQLEYKPNREGLDAFLDKVYLPLKQRLPNAEMHIVGLIGDKSLQHRWESYPDVTVTGFVDNLRKEYEDCQVVVVPVFRCGATNIKILEAMSMNRACIASKEAYSAFRNHFVDKRDLYVAENIEAFVDSVYTLLTDEVENKRIANYAKEAMKAYYSFDSFAQIVKTAIR